MNPTLALLKAHHRSSLAAATVAALMLAWLDAAVGTQLDVAHLHFGLIALVAWLCARHTAVLFATGVSLLSLAADIINAPQPPLVLSLNLLLTLGTFVSAALVVNALVGALRQLNRLARYDDLTAVANARHFQALLYDEFQRSRRYSRPLSVAFIDLDNFKPVNDTLGHEAGDAVLAAVATLMSERIRTQDVLGRLGGDEFGLMFPETDLAEAKLVLERIEAEVSSLAKSKGWPVTISIGATALPGDSTETCTAQDMLQHADALMYQVKRHGKGRVLADWFPSTIEPEPGTPSPAPAG
ncbi:MAG TPA: GGDEF domain-containing protein [Coriobacteriia bacterium]